MNKTGFNLNKKSQKFYKPTLIECFLLPYCNLAPLIKWPLLRNIMDSFEVQVKWDAETIIVSTLVLKPLFDLASSEEKIHIYIYMLHQTKSARTYTFNYTASLDKGGHH